MTSTDSSKAPDYGRRIIWLGVFAILTAVLYSAGWFWTAREGERRLDNALAQAADGGVQIECANRAIKGYPFRLGLFCDSTAFTHDERGIELKAGALRTAAQVYDPRHSVVELDSPATLETQRLPPLEFDWSLLRASFRAELPVPDRVSIEVKDVVAIANEALAMSADYGAFHMRKENADAAFAGEWTALKIDPSITPGRIIPHYALSYDVLVKNGVALIASRTYSARETAAEIRQFQVAFTQGGTLQATGPLSINADGLVSGDVSLTFTDASKLGAALSAALPEAADVIGPALAAAGASAGEGKPARLTLTIRDGAVSAGFFPIGNIPPVQ